MAKYHLEWFADKLLKLMEQKKLTQLGLSKILGIRQSQISNWINGKSMPNYKSFFLLREKLELTDDEFISLL